MLWLLVPVAGIVAVWLFTPLREVRSAQALADTVRAFGEGPVGMVVMPLLYALGLLLFLPVNLLIAATAIAFDPMRSFLFSLCGSLLGATAAYWAGRALGSDFVEQFSGKRLTAVGEKLRAHPFKATLVVRFVPVGSFSMINLLAGGFRVPFWGYLAGNALGVLPGIVFFTLLGGQLPGLLKSPTPTGIAIFVGVLLAAIAFGLVMKRWLTRRGASV